MGKRYLIDTNIIVGYLNNNIPETGMEFMHKIIDEVPNISVITKIELLRFNAPPKSYNVLLDFIKSSNVLNLDDKTVNATITLCRNNSIKIPDAIIAATSLAHSFSLITRNVSDFKKIKNLKVVNPWHIQ